MIENCFGILSSKWRIFKTPINAHVETVENIIKCCVCLHNWINADKTINYVGSELIDREENNVLIDGSWRQESSNFMPLQSTTANPTYSSKAIRDNFAEYFMGTGKVDWQNNSV